MGSSMGELRIDRKHHGFGEIEFVDVWRIQDFDDGSRDRVATQLVISVRQLTVFMIMIKHDWNAVHVRNAPDDRHPVAQHVPWRNASSGIPDDRDRVKPLWPIVERRLPWECP